jgi:hypothetical protein
MIQTQVEEDFITLPEWSLELQRLEYIAVALASFPVLCPIRIDSCCYTRLHHMENLWTL